MLFGDVVDGKMVLNTFGKIIDYHWKKLPHHFRNIELDGSQIMPNHFHGIIHIIKTIDGDENVGAMHLDQNNFNKIEKPDLNASPLLQKPHGAKPGSLGAIMQNYQSITSRKINKIRKTPGMRLWQRNYYERIIRDEPELNRIRKYIIDNPMKWEYDKYYDI